MPNWCDNKVWLEKPEVWDMIANEDDTTAFENILPIAEDVEAHTVWGTKWNLSEVVRDGEYVYFMSAWSPPLGVLEALSKYTAISAWWAEPGLDFVGQAYFSGGEMEWIEEAEFSQAEEWLEENFPESYTDFFLDEDVLAENE